MLELASFQKVSLETGEIIVRDSRGEPCFLFNIQAFIKFNKTLFFPLSQYNKLPSLFARSKYGPASSSDTTFKGNNQEIDNICSGQELNESAIDTEQQVKTGKLLGTDNAYVEEITVFVNCGFLRLTILVDASRLVLSKLAFYSADPSSMSRSKITKNQQQFQYQPMSLFQSDSDCNNPLLAIPIGARYLCESRVLLRNTALLTELYIERFELKRITHEYQQMEAPTGVLSAKHVAAASRFRSMPFQSPVPNQQQQQQLLLQSTKSVISQSQTIDDFDPLQSLSFLRKRRSVDLSQQSLTKIKPKINRQQDDSSSMPKIHSIHFDTIVCEQTAGSKPLDRFMNQKLIDNIMILPAAWRTSSTAFSFKQQIQLGCIIITNLILLLKGYLDYWYFSNILIK